MTAIILGAGFSRRFRREKLLIDINRKPMIVHVIDLVVSMGFDEAILVYRHEDIKNIAIDKNITCVYNPNAAEGLSSSVKCGIRNSRATDAYIFFMGDQPFINKETVNKLLNAFKEQKGTIIVPKYDGHRGNPVIFASQWKEQLESITGDAGGRSIIEGNLDDVYFIEIADSKVGMDIDTEAGGGILK